jgi:hypothetical protein
MFQRYQREQSDGRCGADLRDARRMVRTTLALSIIVAVLFTAVSGLPGPAVADDSDTCFRESGDVAIAASQPRHRFEKRQSQILIVLSI